MSKEDSYVVAGCKPWCEKSALEKGKILGGCWYFVKDKKELEVILEKSSPKYIFFLHWNWVVSKEIVKKYNCVCFHMTDLPYGRGGSPLQNLIIRKNKETLLTALKMVEELDAGPIYCKSPLSLTGRAEDIYTRANLICWEMIEHIIKYNPVPQEQTGAVVRFKRRIPEESELPKTGGLEEIYDFIRMLDAPSYPLAFINYGEFKIEMSHASFNENEVVAQIKISQKNKEG
jgi:methionyl-tRNA formyltransferase